ncbi:MAG: GntR family transcriptional regulator, partial [Planctomycetes bacterium]|nr:GntR family transcriptional regulator [Planctomycetota bacterium]
MSIKINIDHKERSSLYKQIKDQIKRLILDGHLSEGSKLPPSRKLAITLNVSRSTVIAAFNELIAEGYIESKVGSGTRVKNKIFSTGIDTQPIDWSRFSALSDSSVQDMVFRNILDSCSLKDTISFAGGVPAPESLPSEELGDCYSRIIKREGISIYDRLPTAGYYP